MITIICVGMIVYFAGSVIDDVRNYKPCNCRYKQPALVLNKEQL
ncbi:MAG: hypothetical protein JWQ40_2082 [Segetibacter sp.]|nr:hypothetical protein [Segetibacter sp.]